MQQLQHPLGAGWECRITSYPDHWLSCCLLTGSPGDSPAHWSLRNTGPELPFSLLFGRKSNEPALGSQGLWLSGRMLGPKHHETNLRKEHGNFFLILLHRGGLMWDSHVLFISQPYTSRCRIIFWGLYRQGAPPSPRRAGLPPVAHAPRAPGNDSGSSGYDGAVEHHCLGYNIQPIRPDPAQQGVQQVLRAWSRARFNVRGSPWRWAWPCWFLMELDFTWTPDSQPLIMQFIERMDPCFHTAPSNVFHCILNSCFSVCGPTVERHRRAWELVGHPEAQVQLDLLNLNANFKHSQRIHVHSRVWQVPG